MTGEAVSADPVRASSISSHQADRIDTGWHLLRCQPESILAPDGLPAVGAWSTAVVPGTVAVATGPDSVDGHEDYDSSDWWYRTAVSAEDVEPGRERVRLRFEGLATLCDVWWNGELLGSTHNMFREFTFDVTDRCLEQNDLVLRFRSLGAAMDARHPRPRWKPGLVERQELRWYRTTLLGRIPGWTPQIHAVGPWRPVWLERLEHVDVHRLEWFAHCDGSANVIQIDADLELLDGSTVSSALLEVDGASYALPVAEWDGRVGVAGRVVVEGVPRWWPHTHGTPHRVDAALLVRVGDRDVRLSLGRVGFRSVRVDTTDGNVDYEINGERVFCRGSCWTVADIHSLVGTAGDIRTALELAVDAGANMLRVGGTMVYESDAFYEMCDELGIMVWQDFMFANMDYPVDDPAFAQEVEREVTGQVRRLRAHPCVTTFCGNSEVEQQASMLGVRPSLWSNELFRERLPRLMEETCPGVPYWASTPTGGPLPFHVSSGLAHYFGVGAYLRPEADVRTAGVRFTPECLGFSNVPDATMVQSMDNGGTLSPHHPVWKAGVPRDTGAGWDFEDVRDHYLAELYNEDPVRLRSTDPTRYLDLSRVVTGEIMAGAYAEWRAGGECSGALTWFFKDLRPGAGWGLLDSTNRPKAAWYHVRRAWAPRAVHLLDRGLDGLIVSVVNDAAEALSAHLEVRIITRGNVRIAHALHEFDVPARGRVGHSLDELLGRFTDSTYAYRFGPQPLEAVVAEVVDRKSGDVVGRAFHRPDRTAMVPLRELRTEWTDTGPDGWELELTAPAMLYDVRVTVRDHLPDDNHFHLAPDTPHRIRLQRSARSERPFRGHLEALNLTDAVRLTPPI